MSEFEGVVAPLAQALTERGYSQLTPVQLEMVNPDLVNQDLLVSAQTGSGKTVAFGIALAPNLLDGADAFEVADLPEALVVAPTRELALQVKRELTWLYRETEARIVSCVGGMDSRDERRALAKGANIVVGTPGRLCDHIKRGALDLTLIQAVVLDEADEMLDLGFREELELILDAAPEERRTLMFSATVPRSITALAKRYQKDAQRIKTTAEEKQHLDIEYRAYTCAPGDEENAIINVLRFYESQNAIVFCGTRAAVNRMTSRFNNRGFSVVALSGELSQNERSHALQAMRDGRASVCIATDVAARGIDLPNLDLVIHADIPRNPESLLHRSGRTGRAGRKGVSALIIPKSWRKRTERLLQNARIEALWSNPPSAEEVLQRDNERLLADTSLDQEISESETVFASELLEKFSAEQIAAAFVRLYQKGKSAPEELVDVESYQPPKRSEGKQSQQKLKADFDGGVWFSLSVGRKERAEPRWLLPMLCKAGNLSKPDIGAIKITGEETFVEIRPDSVDGFVKSVGEDMRLEKEIIVTQLEGTPEITVVTYDKPGRFHDKPKGERRRDDKPDRKKFSDRKGSGRKPVNQNVISEGAQKPEKKKKKKSRDNAEAPRDFQKADEGKKTKAASENQPKKKAASKRKPKSTFAGLKKKRVKVKWDS